MSQATTWGVPQAADAPVDPGTYAQRDQDSFDALLSSHNGATRPSYAVKGTVWRDDDTGQFYLYDGVSDREIAINAGAPASASATGSTGQVAWDADYFYICTATDTWKRVAVATW